MVRKKVALITLHRVKNYGSALQSYATQTLIHDSGADVEFVDYWRPDLTDSVDDYFRRSRWARYPWMRIPFGVVKGPWVNRNREVFNGFVDRELKVGDRRYYSIDELRADPPVADVYCVGSDQVWNSDYNSGGSEPYFLTFAPEGARRISFSSSLGKSHLDETSTQLAAEQLAKFAAVSVREESAVGALREIGVHSENTLDPTLAIDPARWYEFANVPAHPKRRLVVYQLNESADFDAAVREAEDRLGVHATRIDIRSSRGRNVYRVAQPSLHEWVSLFKNADYVVTDSFHGTAFSLIFNVPFTVIFPGTYAERLRSVLSLAGLLDRVSSSDLEFSPAAIEWEVVNRRLDQARSKSRDFLLGAIAASVPRSQVEQTRSV